MDQTLKKHGKVGKKNQTELQSHLTQTFTIRGMGYINQEQDNKPFPGVWMVDGDKEKKGLNYKRGMTRMARDTTVPAALDTWQV